GDRRCIRRRRVEGELGRARLRVAFALIAAVFLSSATAPAALVRLNQLGLLPDGPKRAIFADPSNVPIPWRLVDFSGRVQASGATEPFVSDAESGEHVHRIDFSGFHGIGEGYRLVTGGPSSRPLAIAAKVY